MWLLVYVVRVRLHAREQGLPGSALLLRLKLGACLARVGSFCHTLQISCASS
jgi:hypothetical protein